MEWARCGPAMNQLQGRGLDLDIPSTAHRLANRTQHLGAGQHHFARFGADDEVDVPLPNPHLFRQRFVRDRQWPQCLRRDAVRIGEHGKLAAARGYDLSVHEYDVAEIDVGFPPGQRGLAHPVERQHHLQFDAVLAQGGETQLAGAADEYDPPGDTHLLAGRRVGSEVGMRGSHLGQRGRPRDTDGKRRGLRISRQPVVLRPAHAHLLGQFVGRIVRAIVHLASVSSTDHRV